MAAVCLVCTLVESLPVNGVLDDNLSVPAAAVVLSMLLLPMAAATTAAGAGTAAGAAAGAAAGVVPAAEALMLAL